MPQRYTPITHNYTLIHQNQNYKTSSQTSTNLHNRPRISLPPPNPIICTRKRNRARPHHTTKIHNLRARIHHNGPKTKEQNHNHKNTSKSINHSTKRFANLKGAPGKRVRVGYISKTLGGSGVGFDSAGKATVEEERVADEVGGIEAINREGDDVVESYGGAEDDESQETSDEGGESDGDEWDGSSLIHLDPTISYSPSGRYGSELFTLLK
jgi:hypothetical protein